MENKMRVIRNLNLTFIFILILFLNILFISAGTLKVTEEHPFLVNGNWISASQLKVGDVLQTIDGKNVTIKKNNSSRNFRAIFCL
jgi:intein/homing endonuclease